MTDPARKRPIELGGANIRGLVFDLDGTLIDSYEAITDSLNHARETAGLPPLSADAVRAGVGRGLEVLVAELVGRDHVEEGVRAFRRRYAEVFLDRTRALPGVPRTLGELGARGYRMAVASNKPARFSEPILRHLGLRDLFDSIEGPDSAGVTKPDPGMLRACLRAIDVPADRALYVGDMALDAEAGARAGVAVLLVPGGSSSAAELRATGAPVADSLSDLLELLPAVPAGRTG